MPSFYSHLNVIRKAWEFWIGFLFHTGAIKSIKKPMWQWSAYHKFLFHTGAIKS